MLLTISLRFESTLNTSLLFGRSLKNMIFCELNLLSVSNLFRGGSGWRSGRIYSLKELSIRKDCPGR